MINEENLEELEFNFCIEYQLPTSEPLVENPSSLEKPLGTIKTYSDHGELQYVTRNKQIEHYKSDHNVLPTTATYHLSCYKNATNTKQIESARKRYNEKLNARQSLSDQPSQNEDPRPFTRSNTVPHSKDICFFCDKPALINPKHAIHEPLFRTEKGTVIDNLQKAIHAIHTIIHAG